MDKNVGSVNLEELKAAREALDRERGIETDPNMYDNYDPEGHKAKREQEKLARENKDQEASDFSAGEIQEQDEIQIESDFQDEEKEDEPQEISETSANSIEAIFKQEEDDEGDQTSNENVDDDESIIINSDENENSQTAESEKLSHVEDTNGEVETLTEGLLDETNELPNSELNNEDNFDAYDNFADFEVNSEEFAQSIDENEEETEVSENNSEEMSQSSDDVDDSASLDDFLSELDNILAQEENDDGEIIEDNSINEEEPEIIEKSETGIVDEIENSKTDELDENLVDSIDELHQKISDDVGDEEIQEIKESEKVEDDSLSKYIVSVDEDDSVDIKSNETEILTDLSKIGEIQSDIENEKIQVQSLKEQKEREAIENQKIKKRNAKSDENEEDGLDEIKAGAYKKINEYKFVDVISSKEFKDVSNFAYVLGKDDEEKIVFNDLQDTCGTLLYTRNNDIVFNSFSSILLSLLLKNTPADVQFVICDAMFDSEFDVFNDSSYMYFNRVAKNNREIVDSLLELSKELENRYNNLVYSGVKTISAYNLQAEDRGTEKMPYLVLFINNYAKMSQFLDADRIAVCLHNILKFGRLVGVYAFVASASEIDKNEINYNLPTRISFKTDSADESIMAVGRQGAEDLEDDEDFLYSTVYDEEIKHLKVAELSVAEIELIIENLEK